MTTVFVQVLPLRFTSEALPHILGFSDSLLLLMIPENQRRNRRFKRLIKESTMQNPAHKLPNERASARRKKDAVRRFVVLQALYFIGSPIESSPHAFQQPGVEAGGGGENGSLPPLKQWVTRTDLS
jgi:hypothetical protein